MKRYTCTSYPDDIETSIDGPYVLFTDAQADKHAALKELQVLITSYVNSSELGLRFHRNENWNAMVKVAREYERLQHSERS